MPKVLVTGCAGFIGSHLTESLLDDGASVVGIDCFNDNYGRRQKLQNLSLARERSDFEFLPLDLARGDLVEIVHEVDVVYHLAAEPGVRSSWGERFDQYLQNNVLATQHLLEAAKSAPSCRFVYASSSSIYGQAETFPTPESTTPRPISPYGVTKLSGEHLCETYHENYGVETTALRFFTVFGPRQRPDMAFNIFCRAALLDEPITIFGDGTQTRDFTYVTDVVAAIRAAATSPNAPGRAYNIGGGLRSSLADALDVIQDCAGRRLTIHRLDRERGDVQDTSADTTRARTDLGYDPQVGLSEGLLAEFEWLRSAVAS